MAIVQYADRLKGLLVAEINAKTNRKFVCKLFQHVFFFTFLLILNLFCAENELVTRFLIIFFLLI